MNNWRLLLLAVVAVLQPIDSFTESNLIDGRQDCCNHRSNSANQDTNLYGNPQKTIPEERRLSTPEDIRKEQHHEAFKDPIIRLRERAERSVSFVRAVRVSGITRFARDHERRQRTSIDAKESRQIRNEQNRRTREIFSGDSSNQHERNVFDSRRNRITRDDNRIARSSNVRVYRNSIDSEDHRRISPNRETMVAFRQKTDELARDAIHRDSKNIAVRAVDKSNLDNNRGRRSLDRRVMDDADGQDSRKHKQINFNVKIEPVGERIQQEQNKEFRYREYADRASRISANHRHDSRDTFERADQPKKEIRKYHSNERIDERRQDLDESRLSRESSSYGSELRLSTSTDRREVLARESRNINGNDRLERIQRSQELRERSTDFSKASRGLTERRQVSRVSRKLEATSRDKRLVRPLTQSLDRISVLRLSQNEHNSRHSEWNVRDERPVRYRKDIRNIAILDERKEHGDASQIVRDRTFSKFHDLRNSGRRHESVSFPRLSLNSHRGQESYVHGDSVSNERFDINHREREERKGSQDRFLDRMTRDTERRNNRESSRIFVSTYASERVATDEGIFRNSKNIRSERFNARREVRDENRASRDRTPFMHGLSREASGSQRAYDTQRISRNTQTNIQRSRENNRSEKRERDEIRESRDITSETRSRERNQEARREIRGIFQKTRDSRDNIRNEINSNRVDLPMGERFEIRREQDKNRSSKGQVQSRNTLAARSVERPQICDILAGRSVERRSRELTSRVAEVNKPLQRLSRSRDDRTHEREIRNSRGFSDVESRRESRITERKVYSKRHNLGMERMDSTMPRESRDVRIAATLRPTSLIRDVRTDTRRDAIDTRFRNLVSMLRMENPVEEASENNNFINWQVVFYILQGAYLCGLLMQVLTEKPTKEKSRNLKWWAYPRNLVKVD